MRPIVAIVVVAALVVGCGSADSAPEPAPGGTASQSPPTARPSASLVASPVPTPPPAVPSPESSTIGDPTPLALQGRWRAELPADTPRYASYGTDVELTMAPTTYRIKVRIGQITGKLAAAGDELVFINGTEDNCAGTGTSRYAWDVAGDQLTFSPLVPDECPARATFFELPFVREP